MMRNCRDGLMSRTAEGWHRVLGAFDNWITYESTEFGPWTGYFSLENLRSLTSEERLGWMHSMYDEVIPGRVKICREASVALEDFLPYMPDEDAVQVVVYSQGRLGQGCASGFVRGYRAGLFPRPPSRKQWLRGAVSPRLQPACVEKHPFERPG